MVSIEKLSLLTGFYCQNIIFALLAQALKLTKKWDSADSGSGKMNLGFVLQRFARKAKSLHFVNSFFATTEFCELRIPPGIIFIILHVKMELEHFRPCRNSLHSCRKSCSHFAQKRPVEKRVDVEHILCLWGSKSGFWAKSALLGALGATCAQPVFS